jgi:hypothetical protein
MGCPKEVVRYIAYDSPGLWPPIEFASAARYHAASWKPRPHTPLPIDRPPGNAWRSLPCDSRPILY